MSEQEQTKTGFLPQKSAFWIGVNIGAGVLIISLIIRFIGEIIFSGFVAGNLVGEIILAIILLLVGAWLGSLFGVHYATKRSRINREKIKKISIITAVLPLIFFVFWRILDLYVALGRGEAFIFPVDSLITTVVVTTAIFFFVRRFLQKSVGTSLSTQ